MPLWAGQNCLSARADDPMLPHHNIWRLERGDAQAGMIRGKWQANGSGRQHTQTGLKRLVSSAPHGSMKTVENFAVPKLEVL